MFDIGKVSDEIDSFGATQAYVCRPELCTEFLVNPSKSITILQLNIRSVLCNFESLRVFLVSIKITCDVIILSECWLGAHTAIPPLEGYTAYNTTTPMNQNDGVIIYVRPDLPHSVTEPQFSEVSCLLCHLRSVDLCIIALYRSPSIRNIDNFLNGLNTVLTSSSAYNSIVLMGDININIIPSTLSQQANEYLNLSASHGLLPTHVYPTRDLNCLDHVMVKTDLDTTTLVIDTHITDHKPTLLDIKSTVVATKPKVKRTIVDYPAVISEIATMDFSQILQVNDANIAADLLISGIGSVVKKHSKSVLVPSRHRIIKPWITSGLLRCIRNKDQMMRKLRMNPANLTLKLTFTRYRNFCNKLLKKLKIAYETTEFQKAKNNPKATWKVIKNITHKYRTQSSPTELLNTNPDKINSINNVNHFFANIGQNLAQKFTPRSPTGRPVCNTPVNSFVLLPTDEAEVEKIIIGLRSDAAMGWDGIPSRLLKSCSHALVPAITHICNCAIMSGCFPKAFKKALVHPIFKRGDRHSVTNYRPISVLPALSKVLEKILNNRLTNFLESHHLLANNQYGFRKCKSTEDAVSSFIDCTIAKLDCRKKCMGVFLDLSKAFDTVSVPHLLSKLEAIGVRGDTLKIFQDYLNDREQCVKIDGMVSDSKTMSFGVPQGSILGPTLFLVYVNNLCKLSLKNCSIFAYADDTALLVHGDSWTEATTHAENALATVMSWLYDNLLTINVAKTTFLPFSSQALALPAADAIVIKAHTCSPNPHIPQCSCPPLARPASVKYLGVQIDSLLNWKSHVDVITSRVRKLIYFFKKLRNSAEQTTLKTVYYALCQSLITYCVTVWGGAPKTHLIHLERAQRAVLKVMTFKPFRYPTVSLFSECGFLSVRQLFVLHVVMRKHISLKYDASSRDKRQRYRVCPTQSCRTALARRHFYGIGSHLYNKTNKHCSIYSTTLQKCKRTVYDWLQMQSYDEIENLLKLSFL